MVIFEDGIIAGYDSMSWSGCPDFRPRCESLVAEPHIEVRVPSAASMPAFHTWYQLGILGATIRFTFLIRPWSGCGPGSLIAGSSIFPSNPPHHPTRHPAPQHAHPYCKPAPPRTPSLATRTHPYEKVSRRPEPPQIPCPAKPTRCPRAATSARPSSRPRRSPRSWRTSAATAASSRRSTRRCRSCGARSAGAASCTRRGLSGMRPCHLFPSPLPLGLSPIHTAYPVYAGTNAFQDGAVRGAIEWTGYEGVFFGLV